MRGARAAAAVLALGLAAAPAAAQDWVPGKRFEAAATGLFAAADRVAAGTTYGFLDGVCVLGAYLRKGEDVRFTLPFDAGTKYAVVAAGEVGAKDLDLVITDEKGNEVARDALADARPVVEFTPAKATRYTIRLVLPDAGPNGGFAALAILKVGGHQLPARDRATALTNLVAECGQVNDQSKGKALFAGGENRWAVYGMVLRPNTELTVDMTPPGAGLRVWVSRGDPAAENVDLFLLSDTQKVLQKDDDPDPRPRVVHRTDAGAFYSLRVNNVRSRGPALILTAALTAD